MRANRLLFTEFLSFFNEVENSDSIITIKFGNGMLILVTNQLFSNYSY